MLLNSRTENSEIILLDPSVRQMGDLIHCPPPNPTLCTMSIDRAGTRAESGAPSIILGQVFFKFCAVNEFPFKTES